MHLFSRLNLRHLMVDSQKCSIPKNVNLVDASALQIQILEEAAAVFMLLNVGLVAKNRPTFLKNR